MKQALCYRKTTISLKSCFLWLTSTATVRTSHLSFPSSFPLSVISSTLLAIFSIVSHAVLLYACPPIRQGPVATGQSEPRDNKDVDGPGSEITGHRKWATGPLRPKRWTESQSWLKGWKQFSASRHGDAVLTYGHCGHVMNFQTDSTDEKRRRDERKGGCLIMPMSFGSLIPNSLKTKRPCLDISQANIFINMQEHTCTNWCGSYIILQPNVHLKLEFCPFVLQDSQQQHILLALSNSLTFPWRVVCWPDGYWERIRYFSLIVRSWYWLHWPGLNSLHNYLHQPSCFHRHRVNTGVLSCSWQHMTIGQGVLKNEYGKFRKATWLSVEKNIKSICFVCLKRKSKSDPLKESSYLIYWLLHRTKKSFKAHRTFIYGIF